MSSKDKISYIRKEVERSGFPLEFEVASVLKEHGWEVLPSSPYWDLDEGQWRETDMKAYKSLPVPPAGDSANPYTVTLALIVECKRTEEHAWVFFQWSREPGEMKMIRVKYHDFLTLTKRQALLKGEVVRGEVPPPFEFQAMDLDPALIEEEALVMPDVAKGLTFFSELEIVTPDTFSFLRSKMKTLSFKEMKLKKDQKRKASERREIFEAIISLIKTLKHDMKLYSTGIYAAALLAKKAHEKGEFKVMVWLPVVVFEGELYSWEGGNITPAEEILVEGRCHTKRYFENVLVSVVRKSRFEGFLSELEEDLERLVNRMVEKRDKLDEQVKVIRESPSFSYSRRGYW